MYILVALYLAAIVAANLSVALVPAAWRGSLVIVNSLLLIGLDLTAGDRLHDAWRGRGLLWKMALLILTGSVLSYALNGAAGPVALASLAAFTLSASTDRLTYAALHRAPWYTRVMASNTASALVDSVVFLSGLALAGLLPWASVGVLAAAQWLAKVIGGALWAYVLRRRAPESTVTA